MKSIFIFLVIAMTFLSVEAQTVEGTYANKWESPTGETIAYALTLNEDGTFTFHSTRSFLANEPNKIGQAEGSWKLENNLLVLNTTGEGNELSSDLNLNKARYVSVSPRNPKFNLEQPMFMFYESHVFYAKKMKLIKTESVVSAVTH